MRTIALFSPLRRRPRTRGVAIAIAKDFPDQTKLVAGAVLIYLVLRAILVMRYVKMRRRPARYPGGTHVAGRRYNSI